MHYNYYVYVCMHAHTTGVWGVLIELLILSSMPTTLCTVVMMKCPARVRVPQVELNFLLSFYLLSFLYLFLSFLYPFLCTSLHSALSGVESGASCATTEGPAH